jgi:hypothetical protein
MAEEVVIYYSIEKNHAETDNAPADNQTGHITNIKQKHTFTPLVDTEILGLVNNAHGL